MLGRCAILANGPLDSSTVTCKTFAFDGTFFQLLLESVVKLLVRIEESRLGSITQDWRMRILLPDFFIFGRDQNSFRLVQLLALFAQLRTLSNFGHLPLRTIIFNHWCIEVRIVFSKAHRFAQFGTSKANLNR